MLNAVIKELIALACLCVFCNGCSKNGSDTLFFAPPLPAPLSEKYPIDGAADLAAIGTVHVATIGILDSFGTGTVVKTAVLSWVARNDDRYLYIALEWNDDTKNSFDPSTGVLDDFDGIVLAFDNNGNGRLEENEDVRRLIMTDYGSIYGDLHIHGTDVADDAVGDGMGRMTYTPGDHKYHAEFLVPVRADAAGEDAVLNGIPWFNFLIYDHIQIGIPAGNIGAMKGGPALVSGSDASLWETMPYTTPVPHAQPQIPSNLAGLIVFISDQDNPKGELYTFQPATGVVTRVTHSTGGYMDGASLSHDRTRIAFFSAPTSTDFGNYEIYTVNVDGSNLVALTTNTILDGHPAWSPDDSEIVYASFRQAGKASLIRSSATGTELANLTPLGENDNDPDWLPNGKIVFKTDRFGPGYPEVRIAVMDADGNNISQLTGSAGSSDHDPTATNTVAVFERFAKATDYSTDPSAPYSPWNIVEARLDGSGERTLIADGWVNWLPVHDPSGRYLVFLKSVGYTDARLMNRDGRDLGRLIPNQTKIRYIDWK